MTGLASDKIRHARLRAGMVSDCLVAAATLRIDGQADQSAEYIAEATESLHRLAEAMGFRLVPITKEEDK